MSKKKKKYAICPCCSAEKHRTEMTVCLGILEKYERAAYRYYKELGIDAYDSFIDIQFDWACDVCLKEKKGILANLAAQTHSLTPHLAYFDTHKVCRTCGIDFIFKKEEKLLWYEQLKFWIDSEPVNCLQCRRELRLLKAENKTLSAILQKEEQEISIDELKVVADIYRKWDKIEKAKFYDAIIEKRVRLQR